MRLAVLLLKESLGVDCPGRQRDKPKNRHSDQNRDDFSHDHSPLVVWPGRACARSGPIPKERHEHVPFIPMQGGHTHQKAVKHSDQLLAKS